MKWPVGSKNHEVKCCYNSLIQNLQVCHYWFFFSMSDNLESPTPLTKGLINSWRAHGTQEAMTFMHNHPLGEANPQMSEWNGGLGSEQKTWLAHILSDAER